MFDKILTITFTVLIIFVVSEKSRDYGQFNIVVTKAEACKGPMKKDCGLFTMQIFNKTIISYDFNITENMSPTKGKVLSISNGNEMMRLQINKPCENLFMRPLMQHLFNITSNCIIKKGHYTFNVDFEEQLRVYYGGMHLFGVWTFKSNFYGVHCNLACSTIEVKISEQN